DEGAGVVIACGPGNNGGDGFALARRLANEGREIVVLRGVDAGKYKGDAATNLRIIEAMGIPIVGLREGDVAGSLDEAMGRVRRPTLLVDALFGTGLDRALRAPFDALVRAMNAWREGDAGRRVLAVDTPSGLDADSGEALSDACIRADRTVTLGGYKTGLLAPGAARWAGEVSVGDIGAPLDVLRRLGAARQG
ncbi:MAG: NAD(P)H-hydrate epimerase, partial [Planctomycetota bacterium]|nr:NAD(P)H-hydrate epimerase [Planctomycetota bacterium]